MSIQFTVIGVSHQKTGVAIREALAAAAGNSEEINRRMGKVCGSSDLVVLSTCSRFEIYGRMTEEGASRLQEWFLAHTGEQGSEGLFIERDRAALAHLVSVTSGLDSWVMGEAQILGQVKSAYQNSCKEGTVSRTCHMAFQRAMNTGRRVRNETRIVGGISSIGGAAAILAQKIFTDVTEQAVFVFGAGTMAETTVRHLAAKGIRRVVVCNRNEERGRALAESLRADYLPLKEGLARLHEAGIAVFSTSVEDYLIDEDAVRAVAKKRKNQFSFMIDLGLPRNVDPAASSVEGVYVYDLDGLKGVVEDSLSRRKEDIHDAEAIVLEDVADLWGRLIAPPLPPKNVEKPRPSRRSILAGKPLMLNCPLYAG